MTYKRGQAPSGYYTATVAKRRLGNITDGRLSPMLKRILALDAKPLYEKSDYC